MNDENGHYDASIIRFLGELWGEGYMSPGGAPEVALIVAGLDLSGKRVLDIGCGAGGATVDLVRNHDAGQVVGIDPQPEACDAAAALAARAGVAGRVDIRRIAPGPLDFPEASFDIVFSKDSIIHISDKEALARDVFRILKPGGWFAASDWQISHDAEPSPEMARYIALEDLDFAMASPRRYRAALEAAGFAEIALTNRNPWYREAAREELARLSGAERPRFDAVLGTAAVEDQIATWTAMVPVLDTGEHCPHHIRARKPA